MKSQDDPSTDEEPFYSNESCELDFMLYAILNNTNTESLFCERKYFDNSSREI